MSDSSQTRRDAARLRAQSQFSASEQRENLLHQEIEKERNAIAAKTTRLRALRLAKEAEDRAAAERLAAENPKPQKKSARKSRTKKA